MGTDGHMHVSHSNIVQKAGLQIGYFGPDFSSFTNQLCYLFFNRLPADDSPVVVSLAPRL